MLASLKQHLASAALLIGCAALAITPNNAYAQPIGLDKNIAALSGHESAPIMIADGMDKQRTEVSSYVSDAYITGKVKAALFHDPELKSFEIHVETNNGKVTLSGHADTRGQIGRAGDLAISIKEVRTVINYMQINNAE